MSVYEGTADFFFGRDQVRCWHFSDLARCPTCVRNAGVSRAAPYLSARPIMDVSQDKVK